MEGRHIAVIASVLTYFLFYVFNAVAIKHLFSAKSKFAIGKNKTLFGMLFASTLVIIFVAMYFKVGGNIEFNNGVSWGCYVEDFLLVALFFWALGLLTTSVLLFTTLINPSALNFNNRPNILFAYLLHNVITFLVLKMAILAIPYFSPDLSGINSSCL